MPKIAIVGCGGMGRHHAGVITKKLGHKIAAACDEFPAARERFQTDFPGAETFADLRSMLEKAKPEAVWICLPTYLHKAATLTCAQAKVHVMLEKPMALLSSECREMDEAARKGGIKLMLAFCRRFDNHWGTLKALLVEKHVLGRPIVWRHMAGSGSPGNWFTQKDQGGGPFIDGCVHNWDFCLWTFGPAVSVKSSLLTLGQGTSLDTGVVDVVFGQGDRTTMLWSWGLPPGARGAGAGRARQRRRAALWHSRRAPAQRLQPGETGRLPRDSRQGRDRGLHL